MRVNPHQKIIDDWRFFFNLHWYIKMWRPKYVCNVQDG